MKTIIIGINPSNFHGYHQRKDNTLDKLAKWLDFLELDMVSFTNCIAIPGDYKYKDVDYDLLLTCVSGYDKVIALGGFASGALKKINIDHFKLPHPSPRNRKLNDKSYELKVLEECRGYIHG